QIVHARSDRSALDISLANIITNTSLTFTNSIATVLRTGSYTVSVGGSSKTITVDTARRMTIVLAGTSSNTDFILLDLPSMQPSQDTSRRRFLNVTNDVAPLRIAIDTLVDQGGNIYADGLNYGIVSGMSYEILPKRISLVFGNASTLALVYKPNY